MRWRNDLRNKWYLCGKNILKITKRKEKKNKKKQQQHAHHPSTTPKQNQWWKLFNLQTREKNNNHMAIIKFCGKNVKKELKLNFFEKQT